MATERETPGARFTAPTAEEAGDRVASCIVPGGRCPKCYERSGTVSEMEFVEANCSGHFANFRCLYCPVCGHSEDL